MVADQQSSSTGTGSENLHHTGGTSMEITAVVPQAAGHANRLPPEDSDGGRRDLSNGSQQHASREPTASRLEYLRHRFKNQQISEEGTELLLASWRQKSAQSYDSLFRKWVCWCDQRNSDPVSGPISEVINFLANLYKEGYQYRSLNAYKSAISSVHDKVDGHEVGQHPLVSRLLKGVFNTRPPQTRYNSI